MGAGTSVRSGSESARSPGVLVTYTNTTRSAAQCAADSRGFPPSNDAGERLLAIYDYEGLGAAGYTVEVTITP